jgi:RNA polymerase sigma-70 factor (ECF subfamily)
MTPIPPEQAGVSCPIDEIVPSTAPGGGGQWFAEQVRAHDGLFKAYLRKSFPRVRDIDDVVQESYLRAWKFCATQPVRSAKALFLTVGRRLALNVLRQQRRSPIVAVTDLASLCVQENASNGAAAAQTAQEVELLAAAVDTLPARCREIFILRRLQGVSQKEIAARLGISEETVQVHVARGLRRCRNYLQRRLSK